MLVVDAFQLDQADSGNLLEVLVGLKVGHQVVTLLDQQALVPQSVEVLDVSLAQILKGPEELLIQLLDEVDQGWKQLLIGTSQEAVDVSTILVG